MNEDAFQIAMGNLNNPQIQGCLAVIESIAGYRLSAADRQPFLYFHDYLTNPQPQFINVWRAEPNLEKWYLKFSDGFLTHLQNTIACVVYHHGKLKSIETAVMEGVEKFSYRAILKNSVIGVGNTLIWDFEYQAFILAYRRCLDHLARAISSYFKNDFHSFRKLGSFLDNRQPAEVSCPLKKLHEKYSPLFKFVLSEGDRKSLRDRISHYEYVPVGVLNLSQRGLVLAGGGEQLGITEATSNVLLSEVIDRHITNLRGCLREMMYQLVDSLRMYEAK